MRIAGALFALGLAACATPYQSQGFTGGVGATQIDANTIRITARGNAFTGAAQIANYAMLKAAEETEARGYDLFLIVQSDDRSRRGAFTTGGSASSQIDTFGSSATVTTTYDPPSITPYVKPGEDLIIKIFKGMKPNDAPPNLYNAHEVIMFLGPQVRGNR